MLKVWIVLKDLPIKKISEEELLWGIKLPQRRANEYFHSRSYLREVLSFVLNIAPLKIPLNCPPSKPPKFINDEKGFIGISHCFDCALLGLSDKPIGLDIERSDRPAPMKKIVDNYFTDKEIKYLYKLDSKDFNKIAIKFWTAKEAAIKYQRGNLYQNIRNWEVDIDNQTVTNVKNNNLMKLINIEFKKWEISIVCDNSSIETFTYICYLNN